MNEAKTPCTGAELKLFEKEFVTHFGDDWYWEDGAYEWDDARGCSAVADETQIEDFAEALGVVLWQGRGDCPASVTFKGEPVLCDREFNNLLEVNKLFKLWRGDRVIRSVLVPQDQVEAFDDICKNMGWERV